jgi:hypothetical protein
MPTCLNNCPQLDVIIADQDQGQSRIMNSAKEWGSSVRQNLESFERQKKELERSRKVQEKAEAIAEANRLREMEIQKQVSFMQKCSQTTAVSGRFGFDSAMAVPISSVKDTQNTDIHAEHKASPQLPPQPTPVNKGVMAAMDTTKAILAAGRDNRLRMVLRAKAKSAKRDGGKMVAPVRGAHESQTIFHGIDDDPEMEEHPESGEGAPDNREALVAKLVAKHDTATC